LTFESEIARSAPLPHADALQIAPAVGLSRV
jgi:hypothetical protein